MLSVDEKSQIQALDRTQPILPLRQGIPEQQTHDYIRHGTTSLFAALEVATGKVTADACYPRHTNVEFLAFLKLVAKAHPRVRLCVICDNYATHTHGAELNYKNSAISEPDDHGLGRSRGGLTTKLHALTDTATCPVAMLLTAGQAGDNPQLLPLVDGYFRTEQTSDGARDVRLLADKAYSHPSTRTALRRRGIKHTIPERDDQIARRKAKGSAGGRPPAFDAAIYKQRNTVERGFNRLKQWRGIATRYDKYAVCFLGGVLLAASIIRARTTIRN